ncbi:MAG: CopG family antitoxin [Leptolyngbyaceae cyanobacterium]
MAENRSNTLPQISSQAELIDFFDPHDMGDYADALPEVSFDVDLQCSHYLVSVDEGIMQNLLAIAREQQISVEILLDGWLKEKVKEVGPSN